MASQQHTYLCFLQVMPHTWNNPQTAYDATLAAVQESVKRIGFPSIDLMLLHAPGQSEGRADAWRALEDAQQKVSFSNDTATRRCRPSWGRPCFPSCLSFTIVVTAVACL